MLDLPDRPSPGDALAQATRARLFTLLSDLGRAAGTAELARRLRLHPNGVRIHLERLEQAGLVTRSRSPSARGRPPDRWSIAPGARPGGEAPRAYRDLGRWLARAMRAGRGPRAVEDAGREIGRELADTDGAERGPQALQSAFAALGFEPRLTAPAEGRLSFCLGNCPYRDAVRENQPTVCALHKGITRGVLEVLAPGAKLTGFVAHDPDRAGCVVEVRAAGAR